MAKAELKTKATEVAPADFIAAVPDERRREEAAVIDALHRRVTGCEPKMWGPSIIGYGSYHYKYESGHEGDSCILGFASRKGDISLYLVAGFPGSDALFERLGKHKRGKACTYVKRLSDIDLKVLEKILAGSVAERKRNHNC